MIIKPKGSILITVSSYLVWLALGAGAIFLMLLGRSAFMTTLARYAERGFDERMLVGMLDKGYIVVAAILVLGVVVYTEHYLTKARTWQMLGERVLLCFAVEAAALAAIAGTTQIAARTFFGSFAETFALLLPVVCCACAIVGWRLLRRRKPNAG